MSTSPIETPAAARGRSVWQGARVRLRALEPSDLETFYVWNQDSEYARMLDCVWFPASHERVRRWLEQIPGPSDDNFTWGIEDREGRLVGTLDTHNCNPRTGTFEYAIAVMAEHRRRGYASEAIGLVLRHFFEERRYQKVTTHVYGYNEPSQRLHERLGFQVEGRLRRMLFTQGRYWDALLYGLTIDEWRAARPQG